MALAAFAMIGPALYGGAALAAGPGGTDYRGGPGGAGGPANSQCLLPIAISLGILGGGGDVSQCNATGGPGGPGGAGADY
jgi:hypothetical protein